MTERTDREISMIAVLIPFELVKHPGFVFMHFVGCLCGDARLTQFWFSEVYGESSLEPVGFCKFIAEGAAYEHS